MDLSIIIVNYNTRDLTNQTIDSIIKHTENIDYEIIVVDNSSDKNQQCRYKNEQVIILPDIDNHGFGHACNVGAKAAKGELLLFLNSDTLINDSSLMKCVQYMKNNQNIGVLGARILLRDGTLDHGCKRGFPTPSAAFYYYAGLDKKYPASRKFGAYRQTFLCETVTNEVDSVSGAFLMISKVLFENINGFDETFFMYGEDLDLCYRVKEKGYKVIYYPEAVIIHLKGQSGLHKSSKIVIYHFYNAMLLFYKKHYKNKYNFIITILVYGAVKFKYCMTILKREVLND
ncbi:MAG: glycosyltransferase family 2 protein [Sedimentibacter saalensis]|uniref:glycosyltransferase family 2 protein n=1 Tax=Sedimentibacter saalensis TaxID=130788 RepID=UPI003158485A